MGRYGSNLGPERHSKKRHPQRPWEEQRVVRERNLTQVERRQDGAGSQPLGGDADHDCVELAACSDGCRCGHGRDHEVDRGLSSRYTSYGLIFNGKLPAPTCKPESWLELAGKDFPGPTPLKAENSQPSSQHR